MERLVIIVNGCKPLIIIAKLSIVDVAAALDPPLYRSFVAIRFGVKLKSSTFFKIKRVI